MIMYVQCKHGICLFQVEMVYSLLSMLGTHDKDDMSRTLLAMSSSQDSCIAMRQSGNDDVYDVDKGKSDDAYNVCLLTL